MLQDKLLSTFLFEDNEYFKKYVKLIEDNLETKQQKFKTQKHHIIPRLAFQLYNWDGCERKENKVNLIQNLKEKNLTFMQLKKKSVKLKKSISNKIIKLLLEIY